MSNKIGNRYEFVYLFDVENGNPNGDPDAGNMPRIDPETNYGIVTDVCIKRKIRNYVTLKCIAQGEIESHYEIYVKERGILANEQRRAYESLKIKASDQPNEDAKRWMCENYFDVRTFGAVMSTGKIESEDKEKYKNIVDPKAKKPQWNCGQVRGPVQINFGRSIDQILPLEYSITRVALTNASDTGKDAVQTDDGERAGSGQFGKKHAIPYALYRTEGYISANLAEQTCFTEDDLKLLWDALINMFDHDHSAARGKMCSRKLIVFKHDSKMGNAPAHKLFETVKIKSCDSKPPRSFDDYKDGIVAPADGPLTGFSGVTVINPLK
jgi:CRISPR-associated protein Csd2